MATGLHQVDNPVVDAEGSIYVTYSGTRGERSPVSVFRVRRDGFREPFVTGITNATSLAFAPDGRLHVSSRFEGTVYRVAEDGSFEVGRHGAGRRVRTCVQPGRHALRRRPVGHRLPGGLERAGGRVRHAAVERGRVSPRVGAGRRAVPDRADPRVVRHRLPHRSDRQGRPDGRALRPAAGARVRPARLVARRRGPGRDERTSTASTPPARRPRRSSSARDLVGRRLRPDRRPGRRLRPRPSIGSTASCHDPSAAVPPRPSAALPAARFDRRARRSRPQPQEHRRADPPRPARGRDRACPARASRRWRSTPSTRRASGATSNPCPPTPGSSWSRSRSPTSIRSTGCRPPSRSSSARRARTPARRSAR